MKQLTNKIILGVMAWAISTIGFAQKPQSVGKPINTKKYTEYAPSLSADGKTMVFQSNNNPYRAWYLYESIQQANGKWTKPQIIESIRKYARQPSKANGYQTDFIAGPHLSADGQTIYFSATFHSGLGGRDIYYITKNRQGVWSQPRNAGERINSAANEDFPSISPDGKQLYFARPLKTSQEGQGCYKLFVAKKQSNKWQKPQPLPYPINTGCEKCPRIQADGVTLLFSSIRKSKASQGSYDLYKAVLDVRGKTWESLTPIKELNSAAFEQFATILKDNSRLYYNTQGKNTPDIYTLSPLPKYLHLQKVIAIRGFIAGTTAGNPPQTVALQAKARVYLVDETRNQQEVLLQKVQNDPARKGAFRATLRKGYLYKLKVSAKGYQPLETFIDLRNWLKETYLIDRPLLLVPKKKTIVTPPLIAKNNSKNHAKAYSKAAQFDEKNTFFVDTRNNKVISLAELRKKNNQLTELKTSEQDFKKMVEKLPYLQPLTKGKKTGSSTMNYEPAKLSFPLLRFAYKATALSETSRNYLQGVAIMLKQQPGLQLEINAHADQWGTPENNQQLSEKRALMVKQYLMTKGIAAARLKAKGWGATQPLANRTDESGRAQNRRVELKIVQKK